MPIKKPIRKITKPTVSVKKNNSEVLDEIKAVKEVLKFKTEQTTEQNVSEIPDNSNSIPDNTDSNTITDSVTEKKSETEIPKTETAEIKTETIIPETSANISLDSDLAEQTQEDLDKKNITETVNDISNGENITQRVEGLTDDDFPTNEGASEEEDSPEYRKEMSKIKASALVEFFDVIFMIICLVISKDFSDKNQEKFTLVKARKNAIKSNVFQIMAFSKKKHNPMGTLVFLIIFSYIPLVVMAIMERIKAKKQEQEKLAEAQRQAELQRIQQPIYKGYTPQINPNGEHITQMNNPIQPVKKRGRPKLVTIDKNTGAEVKLMKNGTYKNLQTGQIYSGGRGRMPSWVKDYIGKIG